MPLVQDRYVQNSRTNFDSDFQLKQNTSKQVYSVRPSPRQYSRTSSSHSRRREENLNTSIKENGIPKGDPDDPKEVWGVESGCEEEINTSGNDSEGEDSILYLVPSDTQEEIPDTRTLTNLPKKNVRFGDNFNRILDTLETSSLDEYLGLDCGYMEASRRRSSSQDPEISSYKTKDPYRPQKTKWRSDCEFDKVRPRSSPEKTAGYSEGLGKRQINFGEWDIHRTRRKEHRCNRNHYADYDDASYGRHNRLYKFDCGDDVIPRCCDHCYEKKSYVKMKPMSTPSHKHVCHLMKDSELETKSHRKLRLDVHHDSQAAYHFLEDYCDHGYKSKTKKKTLEAVQEQQEQLSDSTYRIPCTKFSSQTISGDLSGFPEKLPNSSISEWLSYGGRANGSLLGPPRTHKMRSRRTRMNKIKNGWKKALVQTVRDGSRNERVGVIVMGSKGPEFYAKNSKPSGFIPFRKSKSFLDGAAKSFEVMTVDCKNVFLSSSEPGPRTNLAINDLVCPEDDNKVEEKIAKFSENIDDIVRNSEEKFYKVLSSAKYPEKKNSKERIFKGAGEGIQEEIKHEEKDSVQKTKFTCHFSHLDTNSPGVLKSLRRPEEKIILDSKTMADTLNEQAKQYKENQSSLKENGESFLEGLKELKEKYPPKEMSQETIEANLSFWGMNLDQISGKNERTEETEENSKKHSGEKEEEKEKTEKDDGSQMGSMRSTDQISVSRERDKNYKPTTAGEKLDQKDDAASSQPPSEVVSPKCMSKVKKVGSPDGRISPKDVSPNLISAVFRHLVKNGCAISQEESENLQSMFNRVSYNTEVCSNDVLSTTSSEVINTTRESKMNLSPRSPKTSTSLDEVKVYKGTEKEEKERAEGNYKKKKENDEGRKNRRNSELEGFLEEVTKRKVVKTKTSSDEFLDSKICKKLHGKQRERKSKKNLLEDKMRLLKQALPSIAAENEAAHFKQLKKYIDRFIDRVEASTNSEFTKRKETCHKLKGTPSTDSSEVRVDACKILDIVSNPFKKISSEVTINIAKKLTDTLVQDRSMRGPKVFSGTTKPRKQSENETDDEGFAACTASGSERCEEPEPTYLKQFKKMRNEHLNNIVLEVKRLSELLRFLDRCNRLHF